MKEKLEKLKKLADAMYYAAANLGPTVGSGEHLRKTMEEYHKFIIHEYHKEEPINEDLEQAVNIALENVSNQYDMVHINSCLDMFKAGAQWQEEQMITNSIEGKVIANGMGNPILHLWDKGRHLIDKKVKVIVIKED